CSPSPAPPMITLPACAPPTSSPFPYTTLFRSGEPGPTGAGDVEVAHLDGVERLPVHLRCGGLVVDHPLADELGLAIGIDRAGLEVLADHVDVGHPIGRSRGGEDERFDPGGLDGGEDVRQ